MTTSVCDVMLYCCRKYYMNMLINISLGICMLSLFSLLMAIAQALGMLILYIFEAIIFENNEIIVSLIVNQICGIIMMMLIAFVIHCVIKIWNWGKSLMYTLRNNYNILKLQLENESYLPIVN